MDEFVFVLGAPRSGTTMVLYMLVRNQPNWTGSVIESQYFTLARRKPFALATYLSDKYFTDILPASVIEEVFSRSSSHDEMFVSLMRAKLKLSGCTFMAEKSPVHTLYYKELLELFPGATFIVINRKAAANIHSISFTKWINLLVDKFPAFLSGNKFIRYLNATFLYYEYAKATDELTRHPATKIIVQYEALVRDEVDMKAMLEQAYGTTMAPLYVSRPFSDAVQHREYKKDISRIDDYKKAMPASVEWLIEALFQPRSFAQRSVGMLEKLFIFEPLYLLKRILGKK